MVPANKAGSGKIRWRCEWQVQGERIICYQTTNPNAPARKQSGKSVEPERKVEYDQKAVGDTVVITWAQNATPVHKGFLQALRAYCKDHSATLVVIPGRYKNATSRWTASQENEQWWSKELVPHLMNQRKKLNKNLVILGDISTQPTATTPLSGFEGITHGESGILGHPKLQMTVIPAPHQRLPKILTTTGACTVENYSDSKAGKKGEFHHVIGAVVVELVAGGLFHLRHLNARSDGAFCDLDWAYYPDGSVKPAGAYPGLVFGDAHPAFADPAVVGATFGKGSLVEKLNPKTLVFHDLLDSYAVNPHHFKNPFIAVAKHKGARSNMREEVEATIEWLKEKTGKRKAIVVPSNHDDMFARWMRSNDWRDDPENAAFYLETALHMVRETRMGKGGAETPDPFLFWLAKQKFKNIRGLKKNESYLISGILLSLHGHEGPNGSRGTIKNLSKLGVKTITGHGHAPGIEGGHTRGGTMTYLDLEYTGPISNWMNCHTSIDPMGKRHPHISINGAFWR